jgi:hypothetical protein
MRQVDVDILKNAMKHPFKCGAEKQYIRTVMTEDFDTISTLYTRLQRNGFLILVHLNLF